MLSSGDNGPPCGVPTVPLDDLPAAGGRAVLLLFLGVNPFEAYGAMFRGALGNVSGLTQTLTKMTPLLLVALGICIAFRGGVINIGGEGQIIGLMDITREDNEKRMQWMERGFRFFDAPAAILIVADKTFRDLRLVAVDPHRCPPAEKPIQPTRSEARP